MLISARILRSSLFALYAAVSVAAIGITSDAQAQARATSTASQHVRTAASIVDGISLGIRKSHQGESELWIEANDLKATVMTRSEGKLFREYAKPAAAAVATEDTREIAVAFE